MKKYIIFTNSTSFIIIYDKFYYIIKYNNFIIKYILEKNVNLNLHLLNIPMRIFVTTVIE